MRYTRAMRIRGDPRHGAAFALGAAMLLSAGTMARAQSVPMQATAIYVPNQAATISGVVIGRNGDQEIHTISVDGGSPRAITGLAFNGSNHPFDVSPDGKTLVTTNAVHVSDEIWLLEPRQRK